MEKEFLDDILKKVTAQGEEIERLKKPVPVPLEQKQAQAGQVESPVIFNMGSPYHFNCSTLNSTLSKEEWDVKHVEFDKKLEQLMIEYKVVQVVAQFFHHL